VIDKGAIELREEGVDKRGEGRFKIFMDSGNKGDRAGE
jgi:hypothetical protein